MASKKLPPARFGTVEEDDACAGGRLVVKLPRLAKASVCGAFGAGADEKLRLLKASLSPPMDPCDV